MKCIIFIRKQFWPLLKKWKILFFGIEKSENIRTISRDFNQFIDLFVSINNTMNMYANDLGYIVN